MNMIPLIALVLSCLAVAISVCAVYAVRAERRPVSRGTDTLFQQEPKVTIMETDLGRAERVAREVVSRLPYADEVGPDFRGQVRTRHSDEPRIMPAGATPAPPHGRRRADTTMIPVVKK